MATNTSKDEGTGGAASDCGNKLMPPDVFHAFFLKALTDEDFQRELQVDAFGALEREGLPPIAEEIRVQLARKVAPRRVSIGNVAHSECGTCGVCGVCSLCGEINFGSGSAFLWATFFLGSNSFSAGSSSPC
jgi:hypothetical protein